MGKILLVLTLTIIYQIQTESINVVTQIRIIYVNYVYALFGKSALRMRRSYQSLFTLVCNRLIGTQHYCFN